MSNLANQLQTHHVEQEFARVVAVAGAANFAVRGDRGEYRALRAAGCLLEPELGDQVLIVSDQRGRCYILQVLERAGQGASRLSLDGDMEIAAPTGKLTVSAGDGVSIAARRYVALLARQLTLQAEDTSLSSERLTVVGRFVQSTVERLKLNASTVDTALERLSQRIKNSYRTIENDHLRAERIDHVASRTLSLRGETTVVTARELVKVDGEQIHVG